MSKVVETVAQVGAVLAEALVKLIPNASDRQRLITEAEARAANRLGDALDDAKFGPPDHEED
jgi:hypothetical protein